MRRIPAREPVHEKNFDDTSARAIGTLAIHNQISPARWRASAAGIIRYTGCANKESTVPEEESRSSAVGAFNASAGIEAHPVKPRKPCRRGFTQPVPRSDEFQSDRFARMATAASEGLTGGWFHQIDFDWPTAPAYAISSTRRRQPPVLEQGLPALPGGSAQADRRRGADGWPRRSPARIAVAAPSTETVRRAPS